MKLIADCGSTKTAWLLVNENKTVHEYQTQGFNPFIQDAGYLVKELKKKLVSYVSLAVPRLTSLEIFFYGAGCSTEKNCKIVQEALSTCFPGSVIHVNHDLLAAARALCGRQEGIAAILGTGSNSCYYDGKQIVENVFSLGFILGDEGSGAYIGKAFIKAYLEKELPESISGRFEEEVELSPHQILDSVYKQPMPNRFLASFNKFIQKNIDEDYLKELIAGSFRAFFDKQVCKYSKYKELKFNCVGSIGFHYKSILEAVACEKGISVGKIIRSPIRDLVEYHISG